MDDDTTNTPHEKALDLTESALEALDSGDEKKADKLIAEAKRLDPTAPAEVLKDMDEAIKP